MSVDDRAILGAANNADLYATVFAAHGLSYERLDYAFVGHDRPPPFYANLTVTSPAHEGEILAQITQQVQKFDGRLALKDSFCRMDLSKNGFRTLSEATWIWRPNQRARSTEWQRVKTEAELFLWEEAWKSAGSATDLRMFSAHILHDPNVAFLGRKTQGAFVAGCIANLSPDCVGLSNVFSTAPMAGLFAQAGAAIDSLGHNKAIVGYESGESLDSAVQNGFQAVGNLRILVADTAVF